MQASSVPRPGALGFLGERAYSFARRGISGTCLAPLRVGNRAHIF